MTSQQRKSIRRSQPETLTSFDSPEAKEFRKSWIKLYSGKSKSPGLTDEQIKVLVCDRMKWTFTQFDESDPYYIDILLQKWEVEGEMNESRQKELDRKMKTPKR